MDGRRIDPEEMKDIAIEVTDIVVEGQSLTVNPQPFKASAILYTSSLLSLCGGSVVVLLDIINRQVVNGPDTFIEMMEWNPISQIGFIGMLAGVFHFWLGLITDRRNA